jgi:hypothetical protein
MRLAIADFRKEILNIRRIGLTESQAVDFKTNRSQRALNDLKRASVYRRNRRAANKVLR